MKGNDDMWVLEKNLEAWGYAGIHGGKIAGGCGRGVFLNMGLGFGFMIWA